MKLIQFSKSHTAYACKLLVGLIAQAAKLEETEYMIDDLSLVLAVMRACRECAPDVPGLPPEAADKMSGGGIEEEMSECEG